MEVDGISLVGVTHKQAVETLRNAPELCHMVLIRGNIPPAKGEPEQSSASSEVSANSPYEEQGNHDSSIPDYSFVSSGKLFRLLAILWFCRNSMKLVILLHFIS